MENSHVSNDNYFQLRIGLEYMHVV